MSASTYSKKKLWRVAGIVVLAVAAIAVIWKTLPVDEWARVILGVIGQLGVWAPLVYGLIYVAAALVGAPRTPLNIGAGILFSFPMALTVVLTSAFVSFFATFQISRHVASDWVQRKIKSVPNAERIMQAVEEEGFKLVLLLRMNPFIPAVIKGYGFGTTSLKTSTYLVASILGFLPIAIAHIYLGWLGGMAMMASSAQPGPYRTALLVGGGVVSVALAIFVTWFANRALGKRTAKATA